MSTDLNTRFPQSCGSFGAGFSAGLLAATAVCGAIVGTVELKRQAGEEVRIKDQKDQRILEENAFRLDVVGGSKLRPK